MKKLIMLACLSMTTLMAQESFLQDIPSGIDPKTVKAVDIACELTIKGEVYSVNSLTIHGTELVACKHIELDETEDTTLELINHALESHAVIFSNIEYYGYRNTAVEEDYNE